MKNNEVLIIEDKNFDAIVHARGENFYDMCIKFLALRKENDCIRMVSDIPNQVIIATVKSHHKTIS